MIAVNVGGVKFKTEKFSGPLMRLGFKEGSDVKKECESLLNKFLIASKCRRQGSLYGVIHLARLFDKV